MTRSERAPILLVVTWLLLTVVVAAIVSVIVESRSDDSGVPQRADAPPISLAQRATVSLAAKTIQPVLSGTARVVLGEDQGNWVLEAAVAPVDVAYRLLDPPYGVKAQIDGGPAGFDCLWLGIGPGPSGDVTMRCQVPDEIRMVAGLTGTMVVQLSEPLERLALPSSAVVGGAQAGQIVIVNADGTSTVREVTIGATDTFWVEIPAGLQPDEVVLAAPIESDFRASRP